MAKAKDETGDEILMTILKIGLTNSRNNNNEINFPGITDSKYLQLIKDQTEIGWTQLYYGRWALTWANIQDQTDENNGEEWVQTVIQQIWTEQHMIWKARCNKIHEHNPANEEQKRNQYEPKVKALYAMHDQVDNIDRLVFQNPIEAIMNLPAKRLKDWTKRTDKYIKDSLVRANRRIREGTRSITQYFLPIARTINTNSEEGFET